MNPVKAQCRVCNNFAPSDQFKLHYKHKLMVCPSCYSGKNEKKETSTVKNVVIQRPPGWDAEDEYLEKMSRLKKEENKAQFEKIAGSDQVKCRCFHCSYSFRYDPLRKIPPNCPYCGKEIPKLKTFNL
ncbi:MAG TPA: hypothetical protein VJC39_05385 [Candidatus Nanoarchaeia archaeon]|nr:hypothetical protein [Candidatus Nanoarchaeia archaeon]